RTCSCPPAWHRSRSSSCRRRATATSFRRPSSASATPCWRCGATGRSSAGRTSPTSPRPAWRASPRRWSRATSASPRRWRARPLRGIAVDVGANIGAFTAVLARAVGPEGHVHAFEPLAAARERLQRNLELNRLDNVTIHDAAVADEAGTAQLALYGAGYESWSSLTRGTVELPSQRLEPVERREVPTTTLDAFAATQGIERIAALKVDVEGAEGRVLRGAQELLAARRIDLLVLELSDNTLEA